MLSLNTQHSLSMCAATREHRGDRPDNDLYVPPQRHRVDVEQVQFHPVLESDVAAPIDLPETRQARLDGQATALPRRVALDLAWNGRARPYDAHVTAQHVVELRQLVQAELAQPLADAGQAGVLL